MRAEAKIQIDGTPANRLATDLKQYLKHPDKLFRRVRDEHGQLQLSKRAKEFHPGAGVYRSSYKNARRLAVTETNMAYHKADNERWRQLDFVLGYEVQVSGTNPNVCPICIELAGKYPKEFEFVGWHPHCRCHAVPIMEDIDSFQARQELIANGKQPPAPTGQVTEPPKNFTDHLKDNSDRIQRASKAGTLPYFVRDNYKVGKDGTLTPTFNASAQPKKPALPSIQERTKARHEARTPEEVRDIKRRLIQRNADIRHANRTPEEIQFVKDRWSERRTSRQTDQGYPPEWRAKNIAKAEARHKKCTKKQRDRIQEQADLRQVRNWIDDIDQKLGESKWFRNEKLIDYEKDENGFPLFDEWGNPIFKKKRRIELSFVTKRNCNGSTNMRGEILLTKERGRLCYSAMEKIKAGKGLTLTAEEADAMGTLWHEITHNRHELQAFGDELNPKTRRAMEMMNEFVARKTSKEFYSTLGVQGVDSKWLVSLEKHRRTGYEPMVKSFEYLVKRFDLDMDLVAQNASMRLFSGRYDSQLEHAAYALYDAGLKDFKRLDGEPLSIKQIKLLVLICRDSYSATGTRKLIREYLVRNKIVRAIRIEEL